MMAHAPLTPAQRADAAHARQAREIERVRLKRLAPASDERLNTASHALAGFMRLHEARTVDESGAPALRELLIRYLDHEPGQRSRLVASLQKLNREHKRLYRVVNALLSPVEQGEGTPSVRVLAAQLSMSKSSVHRSLQSIRAWLVDEGIGGN